MNQCRAVSAVRNLVGKEGLDIPVTFSSSVMQTVAVIMPAFIAVGEMRIIHTAILAQFIAIIAMISVLRMMTLRINLETHQGKLMRVRWAGNGWRRSLLASLANIDVMMLGIMNGMLITAGQSATHAVCILSLIAITTVLVMALYGMLLEATGRLDS